MCAPTPLLAAALVGCQLLGGVLGAPEPRAFEAVEPVLFPAPDATGRVAGQRPNQGGVYEPNPWHLARVPVTAGRALPAAPADAVAPGVEALRRNPSFRATPVWHPQTENVPDPFPQRYSVATTFDETVKRWMRGYSTQCVDSPGDWMDKNGNTCYIYRRYDWCTGRGQRGRGWDLNWGSLSLWARDGVDAAQACCACGGGSTAIRATEAEQPLAERQLFAPEDALPDTGSVPQEVPPMAPADAVPEQFAEYLGDVQRSSERPELMGLSVQYYRDAPTDCSVPLAASAVDRALDYGGPAALLRNRRLQWAAMHVNPEGPYWAKWTGSLRLFSGGHYSFDLDIDFDTPSVLRVDGVELLTAGQCRAARNPTSCAAKRCIWVPPTDTAGSACKPPYARLEPNLLQQHVSPHPSFLQAEEAPSSQPPSQRPSHRKSPKPHVSLISQPYYAPAPGPLISLAPMPMPMPMPVYVEPQPPALAPAPAPAPASLETTVAPFTFAPTPPPRPTDLMVPAPAPIPAPEPSPTPSPPAQSFQSREFELSAGWHCVEALVLVTPFARSMQLRYSGPDTEGRETVVPGQVLYCEGVAKACKGGGGPKACARFVPHCPQEAVGRV